MLCHHTPEVSAVNALNVEAILAKPYVIVEQAGHVGERDIDRFDDYWKALDALNSNYGRGERETMHVEIAYDAPEGRTYEV